MKPKETPWSVDIYAKNINKLKQKLKKSKYFVKECLSSIEQPKNIQEV